MRSFFDRVSTRARSRAVAFAILLGSLCVSVAAPVEIAAAKPVTHTVVIDGTKYEPAALSVKRGDTVVWVNKDPFPHTVTSKGAFDSKDIAAGKSWKYTARKAGKFDYICTLHPNMKATLTVE